MAQTLEQQVADLVTATTALTDAVNVKKTTLDDAVAAARTAESRALPAAATAEAKALEAAEARDRAVEVTGLETVAQAVDLALLEEIASINSSVAEVASDKAVVISNALQSRADKTAAALSAQEAEGHSQLAKEISGLDTVTQAVGLAIPPAIQDSARRAIERASGGKRTIIYDVFGNANIMNVFHKTTYQNLKLQAIYGAGVVQAFKKDSGADFSEIFLGTYQSSGNQYVSEARQIPKYSVNFDHVVAGHKAKGEGWGTLSIWDRALLIHIMETLGWQPRGNTAHGMAHDATHETGQRQDALAAGDSAGVGNILTGTGPDTWNHDGTAHGAADLVGNLSEWIYGMKLVDGRFFLDLHNNQEVESEWTAQEAYVTGPSVPQLANAKLADINSSTTWTSLGKTADYVTNELMKRALIEPAAQDLLLNGRFYANTEGERLPIVGGARYYAGSAGPAVLYLHYARTSAGSSITSRARFAI